MVTLANTLPLNVSCLMELKIEGENDLYSYYVDRQLNLL